MPIPFALLGKLALVVTPIVINESKKMLHVSRLQKQIKEMENEISNKKLEIGNYCHERYAEINNVDNAVLGAKLLSISDIVKEIAGIEENISQILLRYSETEVIEMAETLEEAEEAVTDKHMESALEEAICQGGNDNDKLDV